MSSRYGARHGHRLGRPQCAPKAVLALRVIQRFYFARQPSVSVVCCRQRAYDRDREPPEVGKPMSLVNAVELFLEAWERKVIRDKAALDPLADMSEDLVGLDRPVQRTGMSSPLYSTMTLSSHEPALFYERFVWDTLETPAIQLLGPSSRLWKSLFNKYFNENRWLIGLDYNDGGFYFVCSPAEGAGGVFWHDHSLTSVGPKTGPLASSWPDLLKFLATVLDLEESIYGEEKLARESALNVTRKADVLVDANWSWWLRELRVPTIN